MNINGISGEGVPLRSTRSKKIREEKSKSTSRKNTDSVELSGKAKSLYEADQAKRLEDIRQKIDSGFYAQREVVERVVDGLLKDVA